MGRSIENELAAREEEAEEAEGVRLIVGRLFGPGEESVLLGGINGLRWLSLALRLAGEWRKRGCDEARFGVCCADDESLLEAATNREASRSSWFTALFGLDDDDAPPPEKLLLLLAAIFALLPILVPLSLKLKLFLVVGVELPTAEKGPLWKCCWFTC